jgi:hypothetical protein
MLRSTRKAARAHGQVAAMPEVHVLSWRRFSGDFCGKGRLMKSNWLLKSCGFCSSWPALLLLFGAIGCQAPVTDDVVAAQSALAASDVMGLESPTGWSTTTAGARLSRGVIHDQGDFSLQINPSSTNGYTPVTSVALAKPAVVGPKLAFDVMLPTAQPNPYWLGTVQLIVNCPSRGIYSAFLAQVELTGKPLGVWNTVSFPVSSSIISSLVNSGYTDLQFTLVLNVQVPALGAYYLDNLRFLPALAPECNKLPNGTLCNDANACTTGETCQAGVCGGGAAVTCAGADACHTVGACVPSTGCPAPVAKPNGTACSDGNACTTGETCQAGTCTGGAAVVCPVPDSCHTIGPCDPASGCPGLSAKPDGVACDDGDVCTTGEVCSLGVCGSGVRNSACQIKAVADWSMQPHFVDSDTPPPACTVPIGAGSSILIARECVVGGKVGCRLINLLGAEVQPCTAQTCADGAVSACTLECGTTGIRNCTAGAWGACTGFERCNGVDDDCDGLIDNQGICQTPLSMIDPNHNPGWDAHLDACNSSSTVSPIAQYAWDVQLPSQIRHVVSTTCKLPFVFPDEGSYPTTLTVTTLDGLHTSIPSTVKIKNHLILSLGDSIASGEGNPDKEAPDTGGEAVWQNRRCHRSLVSWHAQAARQLEQVDPRSSVTFLSFACSGAGITAGLLNEYGGVEPDGTNEYPQINRAQVTLWGAREIDAVLVQIGANDSGFGDTVEKCAIPSLYKPDTLALVAIALIWPWGTAAAITMAALPDGDWFTCATGENEDNVVNPALATLGDTLYPQLNSELRSRLRLTRPQGIYIAEYPDPTHSDDGSYCSDIRLEGAVADTVIEKVPVADDLFLIGAVATSGLFGAPFNFLISGDILDGVISGDEVVWAHDHFIVPLNNTVASAASAHNWTLLGNVNTPARFGKHGYCASNRWFRHYGESKTVQKNISGTLHPNVAGHGAYADLLFTKLVSDLLP